MLFNPIVFAATTSSRLFGQRLRMWHNHQHLTLRFWTVDWRNYSRVLRNKFTGQTWLNGVRKHQLFYDWNVCMESTLSQIWKLKFCFKQPVNVRCMNSLVWNTRQGFLSFFLQWVGQSKQINTTKGMRSLVMICVNKSYQRYTRSAEQKNKQLQRTHIQPSTVLSFQTLKRRTTFEFRNILLTNFLRRLWLFVSKLS